MLDDCKGDVIHFRIIVKCLSNVCHMSKDQRHKTCGKFQFN